MKHNLHKAWPLPPQHQSSLLQNTKLMHRRGVEGLVDSSVMPKKNTFAPFSANFLLGNEIQYELLEKREGISYGFGDPPAGWSSWACWFLKNSKKKPNGPHFPKSFNPFSTAQLSVQPEPSCPNRGASIAQLAAAGETPCLHYSRSSMMSCFRNSAESWALVKAK